MSVTLDDLRRAAHAKGMTVEIEQGRRLWAISKSHYEGNMRGVLSFGSGHMQEAMDAIAKGESVSVVID